MHRFSIISGRITPTPVHWRTPFILAAVVSLCIGSPLSATEDVASLEPLVARSMPLPYSLVVGFLGLSLAGFAIWRRRLGLSQAQTKVANDNRQEVSSENHAGEKRDEFLNLVSHDLKEPLRGIQINADFLLSDSLPTDAARRIERIKDLSKRMEQMVNDLSVLARLDDLQTDDSTCEPSAILEKIVAERGVWLQTRGASIKILGPLPELRVSAEHVRAIFQPILVNAISFNRNEKPEVTVLFDDRSFVFRDNGIGIDAGHHDKAFKVFTQLNKAGDFEQGAGCGLTIAERLITHYGGQIKIESSLGEGTTIFVNLPLSSNTSRFKTTKG